MDFDGENGNAGQWAEERSETKAEFHSDSN